MGAPSRGSCTKKNSRTLANEELTLYSAMRLVLSPALGTSTRLCPCLAHRQGALIGAPFALVIKFHENHICTVLFVFRPYSFQGCVKKTTLLETHL